MVDEKINIQLSGAEALVLFEFLSRFKDNEKLDIMDQAEERVLWDIHSSLEAKLVVTFKPDYLKLLKEAQEEIKNGNI